jgi:predicted ATP-grasp superfamily ATP-dependent carboligase
MMDRQRVLILDGHSNIALACARSLGRAGYRVFVASYRRWPLASWSRYCCGQFRIAGQKVEAFAALRAWARQRGIQVVLPLTEHACALCNAERRAWEGAGIVVGCGPGEMLEGAFDKAQTLRRAAACGVRIPPTRVPGSLAEVREAAEEVGFPCVVKARWSEELDGDGLVPDLGTAYVADAAELEDAALARKQGPHWPLIQGFVPGEGKGVFALCDRGRAVAWFAHQRLRDVRPTGSGSSLRRSVRLEPRLQQPAERLLAELAWHGPAMVEFRDDGARSPCLMEVNGRFWGSLQLSIDAGIDFPRLWVSILTGQPVEPCAGYAEGLVLRWLWGDVKRLLFILAGPPPGYPGSYPTLWQGVREVLGPQPAGTRLEVGRPDDPWPAVGEWVEGLRDLAARLWRKTRRGPDPSPKAGPGAAGGAGRVPGAWTGAVREALASKGP